MRKVIEYTIVSADGVWSQPFALNGRAHQDDAYMRDGLGQLHACEAMLMGRNTYEAFAKIWPDRSGSHPWGERIFEMKKYVFSSQLDQVEWHNCELVRTC
jgi:dihydrofolate reductase